MKETNKNRALFPKGDVGFEGNEPRRDCSDTFEEVLGRRIKRRSVLKGAAAAFPLLAATNDFANNAKAQAPEVGLTFSPIPLDQTDDITLPAGYAWNPIARWGDPLTPGAPEFDPNNLTPEAQAQQIGYNADYVSWFDLPGIGQQRGIVTNNHEYTNGELMFPNYDEASEEAVQQSLVEIEAHGVSVFEVEAIRVNEGFFRWRMVRGSRYNRRITGSTPIDISGPLAGDPRLRTSYDPGGTAVLGTLNNCGGGVTPWKTLLTAEENFDQYFANNDSLPEGAEKESNGRFGISGGGSSRPWYKAVDRFDVSKEPNEPNRFGYVVEIDPYDPDRPAVKRTALGRFKHEAAATTLAADGRAVVYSGYSGDDARFEYAYKFVSDGIADLTDRAANFSLLDSGTLYVAKFNDDGSGEWLPLIQGEGPLTAANGFATQQDGLLHTRFAADLLGATQMDRPEDIDFNPKTGKVNIALTNNTRRTEEQVDAVNPRADNSYGHIVEITETGGDNGAETFDWEILMLCGDPDNPEDAAFFPFADTSQISPIGNPDNLAFSRTGDVLWIATDGQPRVLPGNDGIFACPVEGPNRGKNMQFLSSVNGCETASLVFNTQANLLLVAIQHPGEGGTLEEPISAFPDGGVPNRPAVIAVYRVRPPFNIGA